MFSSTILCGFPLSCRDTATAGPWGDGKGVQSSLMGMSSDLWNRLWKNAPNCCVPNSHLLKRARQTGMTPEQSQSKNLILFGNLRLADMHLHVKIYENDSFYASVSQ